MTDENLVGQTLAGKYRVEQVLGKGGMGLVLGARHIRLDEPVAIKILRASMMEVDGMVIRFLKEARAASKIKSLHVVRVTDVDTLEDGVPYMVMEHLTGIDFHEMRRREGQLPITSAVGYLLEACEAIAEAHTLGIVHRDLKPSNLFLHQRKDGTSVVKVLDFGISKLDAPGEQDTTKTGQMMGSPKYMSPEQMMSMHNVDGRSDIWSLGAILYEFFTGRPPFVADTTPRICALVLNADPALPSSLRPELPIELEHIVLRCLKKDPTQRFANVSELVDALEPFGPPVPDDARRSRVSHLSPLMTTSTAGVLPSPTLWDAVTKIEGSVPKSRSRRRIAAVLAGTALAGGLVALYATHGGETQIAAGGPTPSVTAEAIFDGAASGPKPRPPAEATPPAVSVPAVTPSAQLGPVAPPEVAPLVSARPHPLQAAASAASAGSSKKKPKRPPSSDPFGGSRN
jgi:serine/threonine protein kinase